MVEKRTESENVHVVPAQLGLVDAISIIVGIVIGVGIFEAPVSIFKNAPGPWAALVVWVLGGLLALVGALCFAELASTYPRSGGEYVYLTRAFGPMVGFLFGWAQMMVIRPGSIAAVAYIFAEFASRLLDLPAEAIVSLAVAAIAVLTFINFLGVTLGTRTQNILTLAKLLGLGVIITVGFFWAQPRTAPDYVGPSAWTPQWFATAMILVLWTYSGWQEAGYVAAEVKHTRRNLPAAVVLGTVTVTVIYVLVNAACLAGIGFDTMHGLDDKNSDFLLLFRNPNVQAGMCLLVVISALGAINGMIFTTSRIYAEFGADHPPFTKLSHWSRRWGTPVHALVVQATISLAMVIGVDWFWGAKIGFSALVDGTAAVTWIFFLLTGIALFILRAKDPTLERPFRVPLYPVLPIIFCVSCAFMVAGAIVYAPERSFIGLAILIAGMIFFLSPKNRRVPEPKESPVLTGAGQY